jgi:hypothetical protein
MTGEKKYLRRLDIGLVIEIELALLQLLQPHLDQAGIPYEVLDAPPEEEGGEGTRRRR